MSIGGGGVGSVCTGGIPLYGLSALEEKVSVHSSICETYLV